jgi:phenylalanyl-tRNA synthetase beta chain
MDGTTIGYFGQLHPEEAQRRKMKQTVFVGEMYLDRLYRQALRQPSVRDISRFQPVRRDFSLTFPNAVRWARVADVLTALGIPELASFAPKEIFRDKKQAGAEYSLLLGTVFQSQERTLREEETQLYSDRIVKAMEGIGGRLRA